MKIAQSNQSYNFSEKIKWRCHVEKEMLARSFNVTPVNKLDGLWLEAVGKNASCFRQHIDSGIIDEENLIGLDLDPNNEVSSLSNIRRCKQLFPKAKFRASTWTDFCYKTSGRGVRYIVYDLFTSTHGTEFTTNTDATLTLVQKSLRRSDQVLVCINSDFGVMRRQNKHLTDFKSLLETLIAGHVLPMPVIKLEDVYTYKNSIDATLMGSILLDFH